MGNQQTQQEPLARSESEIFDPEYLKTRSYLQDLGDETASISVSHHRNDRDFVKRLYGALAADKKRAVWAWEESDPTPEWLNEVHKRIEIADAYVFILSESSVRDEVCNWEFDHAVQCGKRIIPCCVGDVNPLQARSQIRAMNWVFFNMEDDTAKFAAAVKLLVERLDYNARHLKIGRLLLVRAVEWEQSGRDKRLLLRGPDKWTACDYLRDCSFGTLPVARPVHLAFIAATFELRHASVFTKAPKGKTSDYLLNYLTKKKVKGGKGSCFMSFHGPDRDSVAVFYEALKNTGREIWIDWEDSQKTQAAIQAVQQGIEDLENFLCVLTPEALQDENCKWELDHALRCGKRVIPVVLRQVDFEHVRPEIKDLDWVYLTAASDPTKSGVDEAETLMAAIKHCTTLVDKDLRHVRYHTTVLHLARQWERNGRSKDYLLQGRDVDNMVDWLCACSVGKLPFATDMHYNYLTASLKGKQPWEVMRVMHAERERLNVSDRNMPIYFREDWLQEELEDVPEEDVLGSDVRRAPDLDELMKDPENRRASVLVPPDLAAMGMGMGDDEEEDGRNAANGGSSEEDEDDSDGDTPPVPIEDVRPDPMATDVQAGAPEFEVVDESQLPQRANPVSLRLSYALENIPVPATAPPPVPIADFVSNIGAIDEGEEQEDSD